MHVMHACHSCMSCMHVVHACHACMSCMACRACMSCHACMSCMHVMLACHACMSCIHVARTAASLRSDNGLASLGQRTCSRAWLANFPGCLVGLFFWQFLVGKFARLPGWPCPVIARLLAGSQRGRNGTAVVFLERFCVAAKLSAM